MVFDFGVNQISLQAIPPEKRNRHQAQENERRVNPLVGGEKAETETEKSENQSSELNLCRAYMLRAIVRGEDFRRWRDRPYEQLSCKFYGGEKKNKIDF